MYAQCRQGHWYRSTVFTDPVCFLRTSARGLGLKLPCQDPLGTLAELQSLLRMLKEGFR